MYRLPQSTPAADKGIRARWVTSIRGRGEALLTVAVWGGVSAHDVGSLGTRIPSSWIPFCVRVFLASNLQHAAFPYLHKTYASFFDGDHFLNEGLTNQSLRDVRIPGGILRLLVHSGTRSLYGIRHHSPMLGIAARSYQSSHLRLSPRWAAKSAFMPIVFVGHDLSSFAECQLIFRHEIHMPSAFRSALLPGISLS
jgi:hypothetical protein